MKTNALQEVSVEYMLKYYNLIVPEIQREYVWGYNTHGIVDVFLTDIEEGRKQSNVQKNSDKEEILKLMTSTKISAELKEMLEKTLVSTEGTEINIGFLYSYKPGYSEGTKDLDLFLIDGQQRFTTLFLLLFYFAIKEKRISYFNTLFKINEKTAFLGFDYRVRTLTHHFFVELFTKTNSMSDLLSIRSKTWFLHNFSNDVTIKAIVGDNKRNSVFEIFENKFGNSSDKYFDYIKEKIKFWHFKTDETSQGEELYITMNSRGQQLADNETIRAKLFDSDIVKEKPLIWSEKWENWQNFFWKNRAKNSSSADDGFNEFLRWVYLLKMIETFSLNESESLENEIHFLQANQKVLDTKFLDIEDIKVCFDSLVFINDFFSEDNLNKTLLPYSKFKNSFSFNIKEYIDGILLSQNQLFIILPILGYCKKRILTQNTIDELEFLRVFKFVQNLSNDTTIRKAIKDQIISICNTINRINIGEDITNLLVKEKVSKTILNEEQERKLKIYIDNQFVREEIEDAFWYAETLKYTEGEILNFINTTVEIENDFNIHIFNKLIDAYKLFLVNEEELWGELIATQVYYTSSQKIAYHKNFTRNPSFLMLLKKLIGISDVESFILKNQKNWLSEKYKSLEDLVKESNVKNQLYVIYILKYNKLLNLAKWNWQDRYNFGIWSEYSKCNSIFESENIFQLIKENFTENSTYILDFHFKNLKIEKVYEELQNWINN